MSYAQQPQYGMPQPQQQQMMAPQYGQQQQQQPMQQSMLQQPMMQPQYGQQQQMHQPQQQQQYAPQQSMQHQPQQQQVMQQQQPVAASAQSHGHAAATPVALHPTIIKQVDRVSKTAWCPSSRHSSILASGTSAGTIDDSFESKSQLELYELNLKAASNDMKLIGAVQAKDCFHSIAWGSKGIDEGTYSHGLLAGGMSDGSINVWNASAIVGHFPVKGQVGSQADALLSRSEHHKGQVLSLAFHPVQPNLLASGASDGEVFVWDLVDPLKPKPSKPNPAAKSNAASGQHAQSSAVTCVAWNKKSPQILSSSDALGETAIWDLRQKRSIITLRNSSRIQVRAQGLAWSPEASTQLAIVYANTPVAEIWDLRQSMQPKLRLDGYHSGSLLSIDWCPHDPEMLLTSGEDGRIACWSTQTGQFLTDYASAGVTFDIAWSPTRTNLFSTCTYDGKVSVHTVAHAGEAHVPKWMHKGKTSGVHFGFGGKLVSFKQESAPVQSVPSTPRTGISALSIAPPSVPGRPKVQIATLVTEPAVIGLAQHFQQVVESNQFTAFCAAKIQSAPNDSERVQWTYLRLLFEDEHNQRFLLLRELGYEAPANSTIAREALAAQNSSSAHNSVPQTPAVPDISEEEFFNQSFASPPAKAAAETAAADQPDKLALAKTSVSSTISHATYRALTAEDSDEAQIREALVFGDFATAVERCLATNRMADAIIFSSFGTPALWESTKAQYFSQHSHPFISQVMRAVSQQSLGEMVNTSQLSQWKETLAILITYTQLAQYRDLVNVLGRRLELAGQVTQACVCYMCSSNIDASVQLWSQTEAKQQHEAGAAAVSHTLALHTAIEKIAILAAATATQLQTTPSTLLALKYTEYASMLASQGFLIGAWNWMRSAAGSVSASQESLILLERIYHAAQATPGQEVLNTPAPPFPFPPENVGIDPNSAQQQQQIAQHKAQLAARVAQRQPPQQQQQQQQQAMNPYAQSAGPSAQPFGGVMPQTARMSGSFGGPQGNAYNPQQQAPPMQQQQQQPMTQRAPQFAPQQTAYGASPNMAPYGQPAAPFQPAPSAYGAQQNQFAPQQPQGPGFTSPMSMAPQSVQPIGGFVDPMAQPYGATGAQPAIFQPGVPAAAQGGFQSPPGPNGAAPGMGGPTPTRIFTPAVGGPLGGAPGQQQSQQFGQQSSAAAPPVSKQPVPLSGEQQAQINILEQCCNAMLNLGLKGAEGKKVQDVQQRVRILHTKMTMQEISPSAASELSLLTACVARGAYSDAQRHHMNLVKVDWQNNNDWLLGIKTLLVMAKKYLGGS